MGLIREPATEDFVIHSEPWSEKELADLRKLMKAQKLKNSRKKFEMHLKKRTIAKKYLREMNDGKF